MRENQMIEYAAGQIASDIGTKAWRALLEEVYTTPKPGLVDLYSCGAHKDMDVHTFERSADALRPYFIRMAAQGYTLRCTPEELFREIRKAGIAAEQAMYRATGGVNTHKGLIFTLGIFCAAAGRCRQEEISKKNGVKTDKRDFKCRTDLSYHFELEELIRIEQQMTAETLKKELIQIKEGCAVSHGEKNFQEYGSTGIRGEAILGYPSVVNLALPALRQGVKEKRDWNRVKLQTLLVLMSRTWDSNILSRQNPETLYQVHREAAEFLKRGGAYSVNAVEKLSSMDADYIKRNISAGGCADLLAAAIFLAMLLEGSHYDSDR